MFPQRYYPTEAGWTVKYPNLASTAGKPFTAPF